MKDLFDLLKELDIVSSKLADFFANQKNMTDEEISLRSEELGTMMELERSLVE